MEETWTFNNKEFNITPEEYQGFVYQLTEIHTNKKYIGKKNFWKPKTLPITKTRKRRVRTRIESNWKEYYSSSNEVCQLQFDHNVLFRDDYYNNFIGCRIHAKHLTS